MSECQYRADHMLNEVPAVTTVTGLEIPACQECADFHLRPRD